MIWFQKKILVFTSLILIFSSCSQETKEESKNQKEESNIVPKIEIGVSKNEIISNLEADGFVLNDQILTKTDEKLHQNIEIFGETDVLAWKSRWEGDSESIKVFLKRLLNVLKTDYPEIKGENNYFACRYKTEKEEMILELIIWENQIELIHRKGH